jgi:hypothetical protein
MKGHMVLLSVTFLFRPSSAFSIRHARQFSDATSSVRIFATTEYTIDEDGVDPEILEKTTRKHWNTLQRYLSEKPIASHTREAFSLLEQQLDGNKLPVILDRYVDKKTPQNCHGMIST